MDCLICCSTAPAGYKCSKCAQSVCIKCEMSMPGCPFCREAYPSWFQRLCAGGDLDRRFRFYKYQEMRERRRFVIARSIVGAFLLTNCSPLAADTILDLCEKNPNLAKFVAGRLKDTMYTEVIQYGDFQEELMFLYQDILDQADLAGDLMDLEEFMDELYEEWAEDERPPYEKKNFARAPIVKNNHRYVCARAYTKQYFQ